MIPKEFRCLDSHEWANLEADRGVVTVGLSDYAVGQLGDIVFLELPSVGDNVKKGEPFGVVESVKAASDLYSPISGEVVQVNETLSESLDIFKNAPYGKSWLIKVRVPDDQEFEALMDAAAYEQYLKGL